ncbi:MAG: Gfo/Idh/MocA family oxidoreductase [Acidobacteriia bacterium]|nr:Gfo/Idh/MocA family oxidoreductase [Terriglobia bacterium]
MSSVNATRRTFLSASIAGSGAAALVSGAQAAPQAGAGPVRLGIVGAGIRGLELMQSALNAGGRIMAVCDLYDGHFRRAQEIQPNTPTTRDYRQVIGRGDIDSVIVATSDHWHAPVAIAAMKAGKDVYCEKPMTHTIPEALEMARVSRETGRLVQVGSQSLSMESTQKGKQWFDAGEIGQVFMVQCSIYRPSAIGAWRYPVPPDATPQTVDWERFLGNAPKRPFDAQRFFQFRNWWDYGTGIAGDEYVHLLSRVHYLMGVQFPLSAVANGGIYQWKGDRDVPDIHNTLYDYGKFQVQVSANLVSNWDGGEIVRFMGDKGTIELTEEGAKLAPYNKVEDYSYPLESWPKDTKERFLAEHKNDPLADVGTARQQPKRQPVTFTQQREGTEEHFKNLFECIRTRRQPIENVEFGCGTAVACHMANTSYRQKGQRVFWDTDQRKLSSRG